MKLNKTLFAATIVSVLLGAGVQAYPSCTSYDDFGQLGVMLHGFPFSGALASQEFRALAKVNPVLAMLVSSASMSSRSNSYEASETGDTSWLFQVNQSYRVVESNVAVRTLGQEGHIRSLNTDLNAYLVGDRWGVAFSMPYRNWEANGAYQYLSGESLGLQIMPEYYVLEQESESVDLTVFMLAGFEHVWYDDDPGFDDPDYVTYGVGALIGKTLGFGDISLAYVYQPWINIDGDDELDGSSKMDYHSAVLTYSAGLGEGVVGSLQAIWEHTENLADVYDSDQYLGRAKLTYQTECWGIEAALGRTLYSDDFREWSAMLSAFFRW